MFKTSELSFVAYVAPQDKTSFSWHAFSFLDNLGERVEEDGKIFWAQRDIWKAGVISSVKKPCDVIWGKGVLKFSLIFTEVAQNIWL